MKKPGLLVPALGGCSPWDSPRIAYENYKTMEAYADYLEAGLAKEKAAHEATKIDRDSVAAQLDDVSRTYNEQGCLCDDPAGTGEKGHYTDSCRFYRAEQALANERAAHDECNQKLTREILELQTTLEETERNHHRLRKETAERIAELESQLAQLTATADKAGSERPNDGHDRWCPVPAEMAKSPEFRRYGVYCTCKDRPELEVIDEAGGG